MNLIILTLTKKDKKSSNIQTIFKEAALNLKTKLQKKLTM